MKSKAIAVVAFDGISPFHLTVPCVVFGEDRRSIGVPRFDVRVCGLERRRLTTSAGFRIEATHGLDALADAKTIIVPSWRDTAETAPRPLVEALREAHRRGSRIVGLCLGAFVLADAGLLDGRRATTHWAYSAQFSKRFTNVLLDRDALYIDEGDVVTSAGTAAGIDCCLHLVREQLGSEIANRLARRLVVAPHRTGGQAQFIETPVPRDTKGDRVAQSLDWALRNLAKPLSLENLATKAAMSPRTYTRRFRAAAGVSFKQWLIDQRVSAARRLLEESDSAAETIAAQVGFGSALSMRLHFSRRLGVTPAAYRRTFQGRNGEA